MVDYSKWDDFSDSENDEEEPTPPSIPKPSSASSSSKPSSTSSKSKKKSSSSSSSSSVSPFDGLLGGGGLGGLGLGGAPRAEYVKFRPGDVGEGLDRVFLGHPKNFVPKRVVNPLDPSKKIVLDKWGIYIDEDDCMVGMKRHMNTQFLYFQGDPPLPEIQFCKYLEKKRLQEMQKYRKNDPDCIERDIILRINLIRGWDYDENSSSPPSLIPPPFEVFRLIRVSSNLVVRAFVDKILLPLVGFRRNYHAYCLMDCESGVPFGPTNSQAIDMMHVGMHYYMLSDDANVRLGDILNKKGATGYFVYDFGDMWQCLLTVEEVFSKEESNGRVVLIDGAGNAPPEDSNGLKSKGCSDFYDLYDEVVKLKKRGRPPTGKLLSNLREARGSANFCTSMSGSGAVKATNTKGLPYDPTYFDVEGCRKRIQEAIKSHVSIDGGEMKFVAPMHDGIETDALNYGMKGKGDIVSQRSVGGSLLQEVRPDKDAEEPSEMSLCGRCGASAKFQCSRCRKVRYCSKECQRADWKTHKKSCV